MSKYINLYRVYPSSYNNNIMVNLKLEFAYPYYSDQYSIISGAYPNNVSFRDLVRVTEDSKVIECFTSLVGEVLHAPLVSTTDIDKSHFDLVKNVIQDLGIIELCTTIGSTLITGKSFQELVWDKVGNMLLPVKFIPRDASILHYRFTDPKTGIEPVLWLRGRYHEIPSRKMMITSYWSVPNTDPNGQGLGEALLPYVKLRAQALQDWAKFSSTFAEPTRIGYYPLNASDSEITEFNRFIAAMGQARGATLPEGFNVNFIDPPTVTSGLQETFYKVVNQEINLLILGESTSGVQHTGTSTKDLISIGIRRIRAEILANLVTRTLNNTIVKWISELHYPGKPIPKLKFEFPDDTDRDSKPPQ